MADFLGPFQSCYADLLRFLTKKLGCASTAEDFAQDVYVRLASLRPETPVTSPRGLVFTVASNLLHDHRRREKRQRALFSEGPLPEVPSSEPSAERAVLAKEEVALLEAALAKVPEQHRQALVMVRVKGLSHAETAARLGIPERMVMKYIARAMAQIRRQLPPIEPSPDLQASKRHQPEES